MVFIQKICPVASPRMGSSMQPTKARIPFHQKAPVDLIGREVGNFRVIDLICEGGMGAVFRAERLEALPGAGRYVALKFMGGKWSNELIAESEVLGSLAKHAGTTAIYGQGVYEQDINGTPVAYRYLVMEMIEGVSLQQWIGKYGRMRSHQALGIISQLIDILKVAKGKGIHHRDIKPGNVMLRENGKAVLLDWGLAKLKGAAGTWAFMSPEQLAGTATDERSDIYSLGVTLRELLTAQSTFLNESNKALLIKEKKIYGLPALPDDLPEKTASLQSLLDGMMEPRVNYRYQSLEILQDEVETIAREIAALQLRMDALEEKIRIPLSGDEYENSDTEVSDAAITEVNASQGPVEKTDRTFDPPTIQN